MELCASETLNATLSPTIKLQEEEIERDMATSQDGQDDDNGEGGTVGVHTSGWQQEPEESDSINNQNKRSEDGAATDENGLKGSEDDCDGSEGKLQREDDSATEDDPEDDSEDGSEDDSEEWSEDRSEDSGYSMIYSLHPAQDVELDDADVSDLDDSSRVIVEPPLLNVPSSKIAAYTIEDILTSLERNGYSRDSINDHIVDVRRFAVLDCQAFYRATSTVKKSTTFKAASLEGQDALIEAARQNVLSYRIQRGIDTESKLRKILEGKNLGPGKLAVAGRTRVTKDITSRLEGTRASTTEPVAKRVFRSAEGLGTLPLPGDPEDGTFADAGYEFDERCFDDSFDSAIQGKTRKFEDGYEGCTTTPSKQVKAE